ncbi:Spy/CpxP family protein refolding chaperone [Lichenicola cladoniae]|uniref:Spy/CpxP family protein refolding chaperone n=1 Tax=Lichenicola cladoniae TaxID=1484109 RepID=A0A6M8HNF7_9PROT|nr:Spy/CpxP family protein refolding chaperone [Lichenicola cladoniae]NPD67358.1 Spy/CpxP family protein refolding chaperone [Acetobacteraceae bacterium]QKE89856.1 Spy/CpxP family protein refolding chaperone [Lichenicola cladoniae]
MLRHVRAPLMDFRKLLGAGALATFALTAPLLAAPAVAQVAASETPAAPAAPTAPAMAAPATDAAPVAAEMTSSGALQTKLGKEKAGRIESHITSLHTVLKIKPEQEALWQSFGSAMRQNVVQMDAVYAKRQSSYGSMNAVQDLQSYGEVEETNSRNVQQLLPPFQALYESFSPEQKKTADTTFLRYTEKAVKKAN